MRSGGNNFNYFHENKLVKLTNLVQFQGMLTSCLENWGSGPPFRLVCATARWSMNV